MKTYRRQSMVVSFERGCFVNPEEVEEFLKNALEDRYGTSANMVCIPVVYANNLKEEIASVSEILRVMDRLEMD